MSRSTLSAFLILVYTCVNKTFHPLTVKMYIRLAIRPGPLRRLLDSAWFSIDWSFFRFRCSSSGLWPCAWYGCLTFTFWWASRCWWDWPTDVLSASWVQLPSTCAAKKEPRKLSDAFWASVPFHWRLDRRSPVNQLDIYKTCLLVGPDCRWSTRVALSTLD